MSVEYALLCNTGLIIMLDGCAASLPMHALGEPPTGLMVAGMGGSDRRVLSVAIAIEEALERSFGRRRRRSGWHETATREAVNAREGSRLREGAV